MRRYFHITTAARFINTTYFSPSRAVTVICRLAMKKMAIFKDGDESNDTLMLYRHYARRHFNFSLLHFMQRISMPTLLMTKRP